MQYLSALSASSATRFAEDFQEQPGADTSNDIETVTVGDTLYKSALSFEDLKLSPQLLQGIYTEMKFEQPSLIQGKTLPLILTPPYHSLIAQVSTCCHEPAGLHTAAPELCSSSSAAYARQ